MALIFALKGRQGDKGDQGDQGDQGDKGDKGDQGDQGVSPYVDRGYITSPDYTAGDFTKNANWHTLDISSKLPEGVKYVRLALSITHTSSYRAAIFCKNGYAGGYNCMQVVSQVGNIPISIIDFIEVDAERKVNYYFSVGTWSVIKLTILGWWF